MGLASVFIACWDFIKDLLEATREFFEDTDLPRFYTSSYIVLILKVVDLTSFERSRPISLCSVVYKIFSTIVVNHMTSCLIKIIFL